MDENKDQEDSQKRKDTKYEPMITGSELINPTAGEMININDGNNIINDDKDNGGDAMYALPGKATGGGDGDDDTYDHANLLQQDSTKLP